jgi:hypothetical protein
MSSAKEEIVYLEDGGYIVITTTVISHQKHTEGTRTWYTVSGTKQAKGHWPDGEVAWTVDAIGAFMYDYSSVMCLSAGHNNTTYSPYWTCQSISHSNTNSSVTAYYTYSSVLAGQTITSSITLSCSTNGDLH